MLKKCCRWVRTHRLLSLLLFLLLLFALVNLLAYRHAYAMTHFADGGARTGSPVELSPWQKVKAVALGVNIPKPANDTTPANFGLPYETHSFASADGTQLEGWHVPHPEARGIVVLFHGYAGYKASLLPQAVAFREMGCATFLVDFRGCGGSGGCETTIGVREAEDVAAALEHARRLAPGPAPVLYGQSMGAAALLRAVAVLEARPGAVILECPFDRLVHTVGNRFATMGLPAFPGAQLLVFWGGVQHGFNGFAHNPADYARSVSCPALVLYGDGDPWVTAGECEAVYASLAGEKRLCVFPGVGHTSYLMASPAAWKEAVGRLLKTAF